MVEKTKARWRREAINVRFYDPKMCTFVWYYFIKLKHKGRSQGPRGLRRLFAAARLLGLRVRIPPLAWISVCC